MTPRAQAWLFGVGAALGVGAVAYGVWRLVVSLTADSLKSQLDGNPNIPDSVKQWTGPISVGAARTWPLTISLKSPAGFPGGLLAWALFGCAIVDREQGPEGGPFTPWGDWNGTGDSGHGHTPFEIDDRPAGGHAGYLARTDRTPEGDAAYAFGILAHGWRATADQQITADEYNAGPRVEKLSDADADAATTGANYGSDVVSRFNADQES